MTVTPMQPRFRLVGEFDIVEKAGPADGRSIGRIRGIASSENVDRDGEVVVQDGIQWDWFMGKGFVTLMHPLGVSNVVGEPVAIKRVDLDGTPATEVTADLYLDDPLGKAVYDKAKVLAKASKTRRLGFSIEGGVRQRDPANKTRITESFVHSIAIDPSPRNRDAWLEPLAAALSASVLGLNPADLLMRAESMGFPAQGAAAQGTGGLEKLATQSIQGGADSGTYRGKLTSGLSNTELLAVRVLRQFPHMAWAQGVALVKSIQTSMTKLKGTTE